MHTYFVYDGELRWGIQGYLLDNKLQGCNCSRSGVNVRTHLLRKNFSRNFNYSKWVNVIPIAPDWSCSDECGIINKVIKLKLQCFIHVYVQATCQRDPEVYATRHDPKIHPHTKFGIPTSNYIQICSGLDHARTETRGQGHGDLETAGDSQGPKMDQHTKYATATINNIGDLLWVHFSSPDT